MADKITLNTLASIQNDPTAVALINANSGVIVAGIDNTLSRDGTSPNQMQAPIDMNGQPIINLPAPSTMDSPLRLADIDSIISVIPTITIPGVLRYTLNNVNLNSANTDNTFSFSLPSGFTRWQVFRCLVTNASTSLTTVTAGLFTGAGGIGQTIAANQALSSITQTAANVTGNMFLMSITNPNSEAYSVSTVYFRIGTAQGSAATADVVLQISPLT